MNTRVVLTQNSETVKPNLTVPSGNSDIRLVAETSENNRVKRRGFRKLAKKSTANSVRPARRIKLNRSIFNTDSTAKPTFHVKTLNEMKSEKEANVTEPGSEEVSVINSVVNIDYKSVASGVKPLSASIINMTPSPVTSVSERSVAVNAYPGRSERPADTRTVIRRENINKALLQPIVQLTRISKDEYRRSFRKQSLGLSRAINTARQTQPREGSPKQTERPIVFTQHSPSSPTRKRKISPASLPLPKPPIMNSSPLKKRKISPIKSPDSDVPPQPPSPLDSPPSPTLSLGAQSDDFDKETNSPIASSRLIVMSKSPSEETTTCQKQSMQQKQLKNNIHSRLGPPQHKQSTNEFQKNSSTFTEDALDIMSVIADDDELFLEEKPNGPLKRSVSQDSIFKMTDEKDNQGNLRNLAKKTQANKKHSVGDLIVSKPVSKSFRIPRQNSDQNKVRNNFDSVSKSKAVGSSANHLSKAFVQKGMHFPPKPTRVVSKEHYSNEFSVQKKVHAIRRNLETKNIYEAWLIIKELENSKSVIDVRLLEETVRVCNFVGMNRPAPMITEIIIGLFEMLKSRKTLKPMTYILTVLTLCNCGKFEDAFDKISEMIDARMFREVGVQFFYDLLKCLRTEPKWIFNLLSCIKRLNFPNTAHVVNNCLSTLASSPDDALREISANQWDSLISQLTNPPNVQGAKQVQNIMDKHCIPMSDESITKLLHLYQDTKCTKQLLDLVHLKCTNEMFDVDAIFADEQLDLRDVEAHISDLVRTGALPRENVLNHFIEKAWSKKEFNLIYNVFRKCQNSPVALSIPVLKKMIDVLENWDENVNASVEVYVALRQAKMSVTKDGKSTPPLSMTQKREANIMPRRCHSFFKSGHCFYGDRCKFYHIADERPQHFRPNLDSSLPQNIGNGRKFDGSDVKPQFNPKMPAEFPSTTTTTMVNGHSNQHYPSFQCPSFVRSMFHPIPNHIPLRVPQPSMHPQPARNTVPTGLPFQSRFQSVSVNPRFAVSQQQCNKAMPVKRQSVPGPKATIPDKIKLNRSFSWEPSNTSKPAQRQSPLPRFHQPSPGSDNNNNNNNKVSEFQQRVEQAVTCKDWPIVCLCYVESKQANNRTVQPSDLRVFRNVFAKDLSVVGSNFNKLVEFVQKEKGSLKSSHSDSGNNVPFDEYDLAFFGSLGVSLMEKCLVTKKFDKGYEVLHALHAYNISYFDGGKNFGAYTRDIPPSAVAIIAVKLCMGMSQDEGLLGAVEVLRASNYAMPEDNITPDNMEYRIKVLQQVFVQLFDKGNISEAYEIIQHLNASPNVMVPLYVKVLNYYSSIDDYDQSFDILAEMNDIGFDLNIHPCQTLYEKFLRLCLTNQQDEEALTALKEMETRGIMLSGKVWKGILNRELSTNENVTNLLFQRCLNLGLYPPTFSVETPWLCQLGCGYSQVEIKLVIVQHLKQLHQHLLQNCSSDLSISALRDFQITLFPRIEGGNMTQKFNEGIQSTINKNGLLVEKVLKEDLNPPLIVSCKTQEQFHSKFVVSSMSLYRWFTANQDDTNGTDGDGVGDDASSMESCVSYMTRMTEFE